VSGKPMLVDWVHVSFNGSAAGPGGPVPSVTPTTSPTGSPTTSAPPTSSPTAPPTTPTEPAPCSSTTSAPPTTTPPTSTPPTTAPPTSTPTTGPNPGPNQTRVIEAEAFTAQQGTDTGSSTDVGGTQDVTKIGNGDWLSYDAVDFGSVAKRSLVARVASGSATGSVLVTVRLDSLTGPTIGSFGAGNTGGWQSWKTVPANIDATTGVHKVFLTFRSDDSGDLLNLNKFTFGVTPEVVL
jgi:hypothetical protein